MIQNMWNTMCNLSPAKLIAVSMVLKDGVGCYMYTTRAKTNKEYTPEKRAEVANYDLANGIINIGLQVAAIKPIEKGMDKFSEKFIVPRFFKNYKKQMEQGTQEFLKKRNKLVKGSSALLCTIICQYFIKRFVSPYFSMPTAEKFQQWGLVKPKLYPGETFGEKPSNNNSNNNFMFYRFELLPSVNKSKLKYKDVFEKNNK